MSFSYINSLEEDYPDVEPIVRQVTFSFSRYGKYQQTHLFEQPVTIKAAIAQVEAHLSLPLTPDYLQIVQDDLFAGVSAEEAAATMRIRGDCLGDCIYLESIDVNSNGTLTLICGS